MLCVKKMRNLLLHFYMLKMALFLGFFFPRRKFAFFEKHEKTHTKKVKNCKKLKNFVKKG